MGRLHELSVIPWTLCLTAVLAAQPQEHWSLRPVTRPAPPAVADAQWVQTPIDRFVLARLEKAGLRPSPQARRQELARRLSLVMHGLPPGVEALEADVGEWRLHDEVEAALGSPRYGERWGRHWLDIVRFAETNGFETNLPRASAWPYRDWVIKAFNDDMPYDRFVTAQLAGDVLEDDAATGFLVAGPWDNVKSQIPAVGAAQRQDELADMIDITGTALLGMTVACARCHDHKFDPVSQRDYYAMQAVLAGVQHGERPMRTPEDAAVTERLADLDARIKHLTARLRTYPSRQLPDQTAVIIDEGTDKGPTSATRLVNFAGRVDNAAGTGRGQKRDPGDLRRAPNLSAGQYAYFGGGANRDLMVYRPNVEGRHRIWISWGAGSQNHARDAIYLLDADGDPKTTDDRTQLAVVDQRGFADATVGPATPATWSGLKDVGVHELTFDSGIVLRSGPSATSHVTADVVMVAPQAASSNPVAALRDPVRADRNTERFSPIEATALRFTVHATNSAEPCIDELEAWTPATDVGSTNVALAANGATATSSGDYPNDPKHQLAHVNDGQFGNPRSWISNTSGGGWVRIDFAEPAVIDRVLWGRDQDRKFTDRLATAYTIEALSGGQWVTVATSADRLPRDVDPGRSPAVRLGHLDDEQAAEASALITERDEAKREVARLRVRPKVYAGRFVEPSPTRFLVRGEVGNPGDVVTPDIPAVLGSLELRPDTPER